MSQAITQVQSKAFPASHLKLTLRVAFSEDPLLDGMLEGVAMKGMTKGLNKAAQAEALEAAKQAGSTEKREQEARTLIGLKGGLPTLRRDLLKLAALLRVEIDEKDGRHHQRKGQAHGQPAERKACAKAGSRQVRGQASKSPTKEPRQGSECFVAFCSTMS